MMLGRVVALSAVAVLSTVTVAPAQTLSEDILQDWQRMKQIMMGIADAMPEETFDYASTPEQRTFGEQLLHGRNPLGRRRHLDHQVRSLHTLPEPPRLRERAARIAGQVRRHLEADVTVSAVERVDESIAVEEMQAPGTPRRKLPLRRSVSKQGPVELARDLAFDLGHFVVVFGRRRLEPGQEMASGFVRIDLGCGSAHAFSPS